MKKIISIVACITILLSFSNTGVKAQKNVYQGTKTWVEDSGFLGLNKQYYKQDTYLEDSNVKYIGTVKYLCNCLHWNNSSTSQTISVAQGITISAQNSFGYAQAVGLKIPVKHCIDINLSGTFSRTMSYTTTKADTQTFSATLTSKDPCAYYVWEARVKFKRYNCKVYWRPNKKSNWKYKYTGQAVGFMTQQPYIELCHTSHPI